MLDPGNPYVLAPHLCAAAAELPLTQADLAMFGPAAATIADALARRGMLRRRGGALVLDPPRPAARGPGCAAPASRPVKIVELPTGRLVGTVDEPSAHLLVHAGAVYPHQGEMYLVDELDLAARRGAGPSRPTPATPPRRAQVTAIEVDAELPRRPGRPAAVHFGDVEVTAAGRLGYVRRSARRPAARSARPARPPAADAADPGGVVDHLGRRSAAPLARRGVDLPGAAHAAEHASIGLLPLFAACDRWDIGGVSADLHPATGRLTVFVYDGHDGGAGFAERGFPCRPGLAGRDRGRYRSCDCQTGCPSCVQSPKCGNGNEPLSKQGALPLLDSLLGTAEAGQ